MLSRILTATTPHGDVDVQITLRVPIEGDGFWECQFEIDWPEGVRSFRARGFDGTEAACLAMQSIAVHLYSRHYHELGNLRWGKT